MALMSGQRFGRGSRSLVLGLAALALSYSSALAQRGGPQSVAPMAEKLIDAVVPDRPVIVASRDGHIFFKKEQPLTVSEKPVSPNP